MSDQLPAQLGTLAKHAYSLQARDAMDLTAAMRNIAMGFAGEDVSFKSRWMRQLTAGFGGSEEW